VKPTIYLDYNATTPLDGRVREFMEPYLGEVFGNPSSVHHLGRRARIDLDAARDQLAQSWRCRPSEVVFTSGGTESNNLAVLGTARRLASRGRHLVASAVEHPAVLAPCHYLARHEGFALTLVGVDAEGRVDPGAVAAALRPDTILVSVMAANNEIGTLQPVSDIGALCRQRGVAFHTDAIQWFGKEPFTHIGQFQADLVSVCAHKFHGPRGAGALFIRSPLQPEALSLGGGQEHERRAGTENLAAIVGLVDAFCRFVPEPVFECDKLEPLRVRLEAAAISIPGVQVLGQNTPRLANTLALSIAGCDSLSVLANLDLEGICASSGSACSSGALEPSHVLLALGLDAATAQSLVRFSLGRGSNQEEIELVGQLLPELIERARGT